MDTFENNIDKIGGFGRFQFLMVFSIEMCQFTCGWSMLQMAFARLTPEYQCVLENINSSVTNNELLNVCEVNDTKCASFRMLGSLRTVTSEWYLNCDRKWIQQTMISVQMAGVLIGGLLAGQICDTFGRKKVLYSFVTFHIICNFIAATSITWSMFCAMRFFIGIGIGAILVICLPYPMEFLPVKWRPLLSIIPTWACGVSLFAAAAAILEDWSHLHIVCAIVSIPSLLGYFFVPESMRWLTMQGRLKEAQEVLAKMARCNKTQLPENTKEILLQIERKEMERRQAKHTYSFIDLFKGWKQARITIFLWFFWSILSLTYYGISFGVTNLHGNLFLNIFLLGILEIPVQTTTFCTNNKFGRPLSSFFFFFVSSLTIGGCLLSYLLTSGTTQGISINVLCMVAKTLIGSTWSCLQVWGSELYPTVVRHLGYGFTSSGARVGGILAPFIIQLDTQQAFSFGLITGVLLLASVLCFALPETKGRSLIDSQCADYDQGNTMVVSDCANDEDELKNGCTELSPFNVISIEELA